MQKVLTVKARFHIIISFRLNLSVSHMPPMYLQPALLSAMPSILLWQENICCWQQEALQIFTTSVWMMLSLSQLYKHIGRKDRDGSLAGDLSSCITTGGATVCGGIWEPEFTYTYLFCPNFLFVCFCKEHGKETKSLLCIYQTLLVRTLHHVHVHVDITFTLHRSCKSLILKYFYEII